eukprot:jgi/Tetstr1/431020/TSEL_002038.t1
MRERKLRRAFGTLRQDLKRISAPPVSEAEAYRGFKRREVKRLTDYLEARYEGGVKGDTVVQLVDCFCNECPEILDAVCQQRGLYSTVEQHVVAAIREHWTVARASYIRVTSKLTWRRYQYLIHALSKRWVEDKGEHEVLLLPYGTPMCLLPSKNEVWDWEDRVAKLAGLEISEDGKRAIIDVMQALRTRLAQFPKDQLPESREIVIQFCADGSTAFKLGHQGAVLAILKPLLRRVDEEGYVMEGWGVDSIHNAVKIMLYEGQDKYEQFITQMEAIKDQLMELCDGSGMKLHDEIYTFKMVLGGDMAWQSGIYGHAGAASTFFCFVCDMPKHYTHLTQSDYERKGMSMPMIKSAQSAAMLAHAMGQEYGLTEPYPCPGCGETVHFHGDLPPADTPAARQNYQHAHFGQRHMCPPGFMMIEPEDMIGDTMHAGIQICPHVVWHTVHKRCKTKEEAEAIMDAMQLIGLPGREVKVKTGKGKAITKADLPALSGPEVKKMVDGHEVVLDAIISRSDPIRPNLKKVWDCYIAMTTAWKVDPGDDLEARRRAARALRDAVELFFAAFLDIATAEDITPYMHHVAWHFPMWMERHGCIDHYSAQCMEHSNREIKHGFRQGSNHQPQRMLRSGKMTLSRTGQVLKRSTLMAHHRDMHGPPKRSQPHMPKEKADKVKKEMAAKASKRKSVMAERADKHKKQK